MKVEKIRDRLAERGLKVTPQRIAVYEAIIKINDHPTAEMIKKHVKRKNPSISLGTVYKSLEALVEKGLIKKIKTDEDIMHYDPILEDHHHLYCQKTNTIADYYDDDLNRMIKEHFEKQNIPNFKIKDIKLHITGRFEDQKKSK